MIKPSFLLSFATLAFAFANIVSDVAFAKPPIRILKYEPTAASGVCTPAVGNSELAEFLRSVNVTTRGARPDEIVALSKGLARIIQLSGGRFKSFHGARFIFRDGGRISRQTATGIFMSRGPRKSITSVSYLMHELGHYVGNYRGGELYRAYKKTVRPCHISNYALKSWSPATARNEEFAEVFAAFLTNPELLRSAGPACVRAHDFFENQVFNVPYSVSCSNGANAFLRMIDHEAVVSQLRRPEPKPDVEHPTVTNPETPENPGTPETPETEAPTMLAAATASTEDAPTVTDEAQPFVIRLPRPRPTMAVAAPMPSLEDDGVEEAPPEEEDSIGDLLEKIESTETEQELDALVLPLKIPLPRARPAMASEPLTDADQPALAPVAEVQVEACSGITETIRPKLIRAHRYRQ